MRENTLMALGRQLLYEKEEKKTSLALSKSSTTVLSVMHIGDDTVGSSIFVYSIYSKTHLIYASFAKHCDIPTAVCVQGCAMPHDGRV